MLEKLDDEEDTKAKKRPRLNEASDCIQFVQTQKESFFHQFINITCSQRTARRQGSKQ